MWYTVLNMEGSGLPELSGRVRVSRDSSLFSGHFPGDPILPGIFQVAMVVDCLAAAGGKKVHPAALHRVKFRKIVRPGEILDIHVTYDNKRGRYVFRVSSADQEVCSGMLTCRDRTGLSG